ncbi:hypothetical protein GCM10009733_049300 [Nonomuraea maheshkhaliensis]|uniref:Uncharacterized protein n=1 Tax=Nonomuraea maheshkhaliensis TaxID=419590 RepID=A0ABP4RCQ9_9ACTN
MALRFIGIDDTSGGDNRPMVWRDDTDGSHRPAGLGSHRSITPVAAPRRLWALEAFNVFDDNLVQVELLTATVNVTRPGEVGLYINGFTDLAAMSVVGAPAKRLVQAARQDFL